LTHERLVVVLSNEGSDFSLGGKAGTHAVSVVLGSGITKSSVCGDENDLSVHKTELGSEGLESGVLRPHRLATDALLVGLGESDVGLAVANRHP